jgi:16S rRNA processing protein RimM
MPGEEYHFLGKIRKAIGISGEMVIRLNTDYPETILKKLESVFLEIEGKRIPFFVEKTKRSDHNEIIVKLDMVNDPDQARYYTNARVFTKQKEFHSEESDKMDLSVLKGFILFDTSLGKIGRIEEVVMYPNNPVLKILGKKEEILIPVQEELIDQLDPDMNRIYMTLPKGLLDLFQ